MIQCQAFFTLKINQLPAADIGLHIQDSADLNELHAPLFRIEGQCLRFISEMIIHAVAASADPAIMRYSLCSGDHKTVVFLHASYIMTIRFMINYRTITNYALILHVILQSASVKAARCVQFLVTAIE